MMRLLTKFCRDEDGAVTIDWVVLAAGAVGLGLVILPQLQGGLEVLSAQIASDIISASQP